MGYELFYFSYVSLAENKKGAALSFGDIFIHLSLTLILTWATPKFSGNPRGAHRGSMVSGIKPGFCLQSMHRFGGLPGLHPCLFHILIFFIESGPQVFTIPVSIRHSFNNYKLHLKMCYFGVSLTVICLEPS